MAGSVIPIVVAHGEGRAEFENDEAARNCDRSGLVVARYVDNHQAAALANGDAKSRRSSLSEGGHIYTEAYPLNPNGSPFGITSLTSEDGRSTILMPHPERVFRTAQFSWAPSDWGEDSPWMRFFRNARAWVG